MPKSASLVDWLGFRWPDLRNSERLHDFAVNSIMSYLRAPDRYDPTQSSLLSYLRMDAHGDLLNEHERLQRALIARAPLGVQTHLFERDATGGMLTPQVKQLEQRAAQIAREVLAPRPSLPSTSPRAIPSRWCAAWRSISDCHERPPASTRSICDALCRRGKITGASTGTDSSVELCRHTRKGKAGRTRQMTAEVTPSPAPDEDPLVISGDDFRDQFGEDLIDTLDLSTWQQGADLAGLNHRLQAEVADAVTQERDAVAFTRREVFPRLAKQQDAPTAAGAYQATPELIERALGNSLFNGCVEACAARWPSTTRWC